MPRRLTPSRRPDDPGRANQHVSCRLTQAEYGVLVLVAEQHGIGISGAVRHIIDAWGASFRDKRGRTLLEVAGEHAPGPEVVRWLREQGELAEHAEQHA